MGWEEVLTAHAQASQARIREHAVVLCIQDTTELDYNGQAMSGLGPLSFEAQRGLYLHPTYVVTPEREPLGVPQAPARRGLRFFIIAACSSLPPPLLRPNWRW